MRLWTDFYAADALFSEPQGWLTNNPKDPIPALAADTALARHALARTPLLQARHPMRDCRLGRVASLPGTATATAIATIPRLRHPFLLLTLWPPNHRTLPMRLPGVFAAQVFALRESRCLDLR